MSIKDYTFAEQVGAASKVLEKRIVELFTKDPPEDDAELHDIAEEWGLDPDVVETAVYKILASFLNEGLSNESGKKTAISPEQLKKGIKIEKEHTTSIMIAAKIARDHLAEDPIYYDKLAKMEHVEINETNEQPVIGLQVTTKDTQFPVSKIKQDAKTEAIQKRDQPIYGEDDDDDDRDPEDIEDEDTEEDSMWVDAFKTGIHRDSEGVTHKWDPEHLDIIAQQYNKRAAEDNPERKLAPVVVGHPKDDSPAYGWIDKVRVVKDKLQAHLSQLNGEFTQALKEGAYKTRSISLYPDLNIRHLGFLGGMQPAVAGLGPFKFNDSEKVTTYEFAAPSDDIEVKMIKKENSFFKNLFARLKIDVADLTKDHSEPGPQDRVPITRDDSGVVSNNDKEHKMADIVGPGVTKEVKVLPGALKDTDPKGDELLAKMKAGYEEAVIARDKAVKECDEMSKKYAEAIKHGESLSKKFSELEAVHAETLKKIGEVVVTDRKTSYSEFCDSMVAEGRIKPADVAIHLQNLEMRYQDDAKAKDFAEGKSECPKVEEYKQWLRSHPQEIDFGEIATPATAAPAADPTKAPTDKITSYCDDLMKAEKIDYNTAFRKVAEAHPAEMQAYLMNGAFSSK